MVIAFLMMNPFHHKLYKGDYDGGGEYNGYVAFDGKLPISWQGGGSYDNENILDNKIDVHGGITLDCPMEELLDNPMIPITSIPDRETLKSYRCIGFDTLHCDDTKERWPIEAIKAETIRLMEQIEKLLKDGNKCK